MLALGPTQRSTTWHRCRPTSPGWPRPVSFLVSFTYVRSRPARTT